MNSALLQDYVNEGYSKRQWLDRFMRVLLLVASLVALLPLFSVLVYLFKNGIPGIQLSFFTALPKPVGEVGGGMANALVGT